MPTGSDVPPDESVTPPPPSPVSEQSSIKVHRRHRRWPWVLAGVIVSPIILLVLWTVLALNYSYSHGERAGYVQKFSRKGWVCKTWEGELAMVNIPGALQEKWDFSVRNDSIANVITHSMGQRVSLSYDQHQGVPTSCFGETQYFVNGVQVLGQ